MRVTSFGLLALLVVMMLPAGCVNPSMASPSGLSVLTSSEVNVAGFTTQLGLVKVNTTGECFLVSADGGIAHAVCPQ